MPFSSSIEPMGVSRRLILSIVGLAIGGVLLHHVIAVGLVSRGDDVLRAGSSNDAVRYYRRAMWFDPSWRVPVERVTFDMAEVGDRRLIAYGRQVAGAFLARDPTADTIRFDRMTLAIHVRDYSAALADAEILAERHPGDSRWRGLVAGMRKRGITP